MPRALPSVGPGGWYHVTNRGGDGAVLFPSPGTKDAFVAALGKTAHRFAIEVHAYCAMETHYHLLARARERELLRAIEELEATVSVATCRARLRRMAVGRHLVRVTRYIHRNPVEAGLVQTPEAWPWSSYRGYLDPLHGTPWLRSGAVLGWLGSIGVRELYRRYCECRDVDRFIGASRP